MCFSGRSVALENCQIACRVTAVCLYPRTADVQGSGERAGLGVALSFFFSFLLFLSNICSSEFMLENSSF